MRLRRHLSANHRGFTLVELIIVVAVIAVLAAVLAPQYLRYVERARQSNDLQVAVSLVRATTVATSDPQVSVPYGTDVYVVWESEDTANLGIAGRVYIGTRYDLADTPRDTDDPLYPLLVAIGEVLGGSVGVDSGLSWTQGNGRYHYDIGAPASEAAQEVDFKFSIDTTTGAITFWQDTAGYQPTAVEPGDGAIWLDVIGVSS